MDARPRAWSVRSGAVATAALVLCAAGLRLCWFAAADALETVTTSGPEAPDDLIVVGAAAGSAVLLAWLGLGILLAALAGAPGAVGRLAGAAAARVAPAVLRRAIAVLLGTALATAPIPVAHSAGPQPHPSLETTSQAVATPAPDPSFGVATSQPVADARAPDPAGAVPTSATVTAPDPGFGAGLPAPAATSPAAGRPVNSPATTPGLGPLGPAPHTTSSTASRTVTVVRGDTLWAIAARHIGPQASPLQVAREWPRWYAANRTVIGSNPNLIRAGQVLTVPTSGASS